MPGGTQLGAGASSQSAGDDSDLTIARAPLVPPAAAQVHAAAHPGAAAAPARMTPAGAAQGHQTGSSPAAAAAGYMQVSQPGIPAGLGGVGISQLRARPSEQGQGQVVGPGPGGATGGGAPAIGLGSSGRLNRANAVRASTAVGQLSAAGTRPRTLGHAMTGAWASGVGMRQGVAPGTADGWQRGMQSSFSGFAVLPEGRE
jgi:hypothetical protein